MSQDGFENDCPETKFQIITSYSQFETVTVQKFIAEVYRQSSADLLFLIKNMMRDGSNKEGC